MRLVSSVSAAFLVLANVAFGAATVTLTSAGSSVKNAAANETFPVDVTITLSGAEATNGISGVQFDLVAHAGGLTAGAQTIQTGWLCRALRARSARASAPSVRPQPAFCFRAERLPSS